MNKLTEPKEYIQDVHFPVMFFPVSSQVKANKGKNFLKNKAPIIYLSGTHFPRYFCVKASASKVLYLYDKANQRVQDTISRVTVNNTVF